MEEGVKGDMASGAAGPLLGVFIISEAWKGGYFTPEGGVTRETMLSISKQMDHVDTVVAGGKGTHSVYMRVSSHSRPVTREVKDAA